MTGISVFLAPIHRTLACTFVLDTYSPDRRKRKTALLNFYHGPHFPPRAPTVGLDKPRGFYAGIISSAEHKENSVLVLQMFVALVRFQFRYVEIFEARTAGDDQNLRP